MFPRSLDHSSPLLDDNLPFCACYPVRRGLDGIMPLFNLLGSDAWIAGSYAAFCLAQTETPILPNDIDIFCKTRGAAAWLSERISRIWRTVREFNGVAYNFNREPCGMRVQVIAPSPAWLVWPDDMLNSFDMDICRALIMTPTWGLADQNVGGLDAKILKIHDPVRTMRRVMKYQARGVQFNDHELLKLFRAWDALGVADKQERIAAVVIPYSNAFMEDQEPAQDYGGWDLEDDEYFDGE